MKKCDTNVAATSSAPRVLLLYREVIPSIIISALQPLQALDSLGKISLACENIKSGEARRLLLWCDIVVCTRNSLGDELPFLLKIRQLNIPYIYDCDDNFLRLQTVNDPSVSYLRWPGSMETVKAYMRYAYAVKVGSAQLAEDCKEYNPRCVLQKYCFDMQILADLPEPVKDDNNLLIGYGGSITHTFDIKIALTAIRQVMKEFTHISFICYGISIDGMEDLEQRVTCVPYTADYSAFQRDFASRGIDIAIAPLYDTLANRSKTNNKYREYGACGIAGIYSDMPVYRGCIQDGDNGLLCANTPEAWAAALRRLVVDKALRQHIARRAKEDVIQNYSVRATANEWLHELLLPALEGSSPVAHDERKAVLSRDTRQRSIWLQEQFGSKTEYALYRLFIYYLHMKHGLKTLLFCVGLLPLAKRIKAESLNRRMKNMNLRRKGGHEPI